MAKKIKLTKDDDVFKGKGKDEIIIAKAGDDSVSGGGGNDTIKGGEGNDVLKGGAGDDILNGGADNDILYGGSGDDRLIATQGDDTVDGGDGDDTVVLSGNLADATVTKDGDGRYVITTASGTTTVAGVELFQFADGTVDAAKLDEIVNGGTGRTFTLTAAIDAGEAFSGTAGDDTFVGDAATTSAADQIGGGAGNDTLRLFSTTTLPSMTSIETVEFNGVTTGTVDLSGQADVTDVAFRDATLTGAIDVTVSGTQDVSLTNIKGDAGGSDIDIKAAASVTAQTVSLNGVGDTATAGLDVDVDINGTGVATLTLDSSTAASKVELVNTGAALKTLNVTGDAKLTINGDIPNVTTITSTNTAGLTASTAVATAAGLAITTAAGADSITLNQAAAAAALSSKVAVDLGAGDDTLSIANLTAANNIQAGATFKGGEGTDTLNIVNGAVLDATTGAQFSGFEVLSLNGSTGTFDASFLAAGNTIGSAVVGADLSGATTINNLAIGASVVFNATTTAALTVNQKDAGAGSPDDVINTTIDSKTAVTVNAVDFNDIETVNVSSTSAGTNITHIVTTFTADEATKITVDASTAGLTIGDLEADALVLFDASASAKAVSVTTGADTFNATAGVAFAGGAGADVLNFLGANTSAALATDLDFVVTGNGGADDITLAVATTGVDRVVYKAQSDSTSTAYDEVVNFTTTEDKIDLSAFGFTGTADDAVLTKAAGVTIDGVTGAVVVSDAVAGNFFSDGGIDRAVAIFDNGLDVYVFVDVNKDGDFSAAGDLVIELTNGADGAGAPPVIGDFAF